MGSGIVSFRNDVVKENRFILLLIMHRVVHSRIQCGNQIYLNQEQLKITRAIFTLAILFVSCEQTTNGLKTKNTDTTIITDSFTSRDRTPLTDSPYYTLVDNKISLDSLFLLKRDSSEFSSQNMWTSLFIGHLFSNDKKSTVLRYVEDDTVSNVVVLQQSKQSWDTIFSTKVYPVSIGAFEDWIQITDFNGDNIPDLKVVKDFWDIHPGNKSELWLYNKNHFTKVKGFDDIVSATYDKKTDLVYSYQSTGCADMNMYFGVFKIVGDKVQKIKEMYCDCCVESNDSCALKVFGKKPFLVPYKTAYKYVPDFFAEGVKEKCEMVANR